MWTLLISRASDPPGHFFDRRQIDSGQVSVGRGGRHAAKADLLLPDETGAVSREHCTISAVGLELFVVDTSTNGVALNQSGARIAPNLPVAVRPSDRLLIGDFAITVATEAMAAGMALVPPPPQPLPVAQPGLQNDLWFDAPADPIWDDDAAGGDMHDFLRGSLNEMFAPPASAMDLPSHVSDFGFADPIGEAFRRPIMADIAPPPTDFGIPEDWESPAIAAPPSARADPAAFGDYRGGDPFGDLPEPNRRQPAPESFATAAAFDDPFDLSAPLPPTATPAAAPPPMRTAPAPAGDPGWAAFFDGVGLSPDELQLSPDAMRRLGVLYRQVVLGLSDIIQDRAAFKDEFRVERTQLSMGRNNPLKHLAALDAAKILLGEPLPGFMNTEDAVRTAFEDIKKHQLAMLAGVQRALTAVFDRLSPPEIERLGQHAVAQRKALSFARGIDRWSVYLTVFEALKKDATSNASGVMSVAFREGYEAFLKSAG